MLIPNACRQAIDHLINSAAKTNYMSGGTINVPIVFRGPNGAAAGVAAQHSQVIFMLLFPVRFSQSPRSCSNVKVWLISCELDFLAAGCLRAWCNLQSPP